MTKPMHKEYAKLRRRPFLTPVWLTIVGVAVLLVLAAGAVLSASTTTVYVVRAAEAVSEGGGDPGLSLAGTLRAKRLQDAFGQAPAGLGLTGIVVSGLRRSQETVRPLAESLGLPVTVMPGDGSAALAHRVTSDFAGGRVLVVVGRGAVPGVVRALSGHNVPAPDDADFGTVYVIARPRYSPATVSVLHLP